MFPHPDNIVNVTWIMYMTVGRGADGSQERYLGSVEPRPSQSAQAFKQAATEGIRESGPPSFGLRLKLRLAGLCLCWSADRVECKFGKRAVGVRRGGRFVVADPTACSFFVD